MQPRWIKPWIESFRLADVPVHESRCIPSSVVVVNEGVLRRPEAPEEEVRRAAVVWQLWRDGIAYAPAQLPGLLRMLKKSEGVS